jgi:hypothetical protein
MVHCYLYFTIVMASSSNDASLDDHVACTAPLDYSAEEGDEDG